MHLNNIIFDGTSNKEPQPIESRIKYVIKMLEYLHPLVYPKPVINENRIKRNDPCFCGSSKKFKKCCMNKVKESEVE